MKTTVAVLVAGLVLSAARADAGTGITARGSTLGIGIEVTQSIVPKVNARVGVNFFSYSYDGTEDDIAYDFDLKLRSGNFLIDFHPLSNFMSGFRLSGGLLYSKNRVDMVAQASGTYEIGDQTYNAADVGTLTGKVDLKDWPLYVGIGWGNASSGSISLAFDLGLAFSGSPDVDLNATGLLSTDTAFQQRLAQEENDLEGDLEAFEYYPVVGLGISIHIPGL